MTPHERLDRLYEAFEGAVPLKRACGSCHRCCVGPPLYMTCTHLEFEHAVRSLPPAAAAMVRFQRADEGPDQRHGFASWTCPLYSATRGCTVYGARPLACRVFGPYSREPIPFPCVFGEDSVRYKRAEELPGWREYEDIVRESPRGYVMPTQTQFRRPAVELLMGVPGPDPLRPRIPLT